jgi:hypothetical protein
MAVTILKIDHAAVNVVSRIMQTAATAACFCLAETEQRKHEKKGRGAKDNTVFTSSASWDWVQGYLHFACAMIIGWGGRGVVGGGGDRCVLTSMAHGALRGREPRSALFFPAIPFLLGDMRMVLIARRARAASRTWRE